FVFFFQAEDGIRDKLVTGVQTCALPICRKWMGDYIVQFFRIVHSAYARSHDVSRWHNLHDIWSRTDAEHLLKIGSFHARFYLCRSEERRVGKECRSRGWPYD